MRLYSFLDLPGTGLRVPLPCSGMVFTRPIFDFEKLKATRSPHLINLMECTVL